MIELNEEPNEVFLLDSNVLIYAYEKEESDKKKIAEKIIKNCYTNKIRGAVSNQNLAEFSFVSNKKGKLDCEEIKQIVGDIINFSGFIKINYSEETILSALSIMKENKTSFWDALLVATMKENGVSNIYTENLGDFKIPGVKVINPFD